MAGEVRMPLDGEAFSVLLPLLRHGAIDADHVPAIEPDLEIRLRRAFASSGSRRFVADAQDLAGDIPVDLRSRAVHLRTENPLTARFIPPGAGDVAPALDAALAAIHATLARPCADASRTVTCALLGAQILLTIHPFRDGNGRTARMFFAAKLLRHVGPAPTALLGMLLMHRAGAHQFHQASWALRAGDVEPMVALFVGSEKLARERLLPDAGTSASPAGLLEHCWGALLELRQCGTFSGLASNLRE